MFVKTIDGTPDAVKVACPVLAGGKAGDYIKGLWELSARVKTEAALNRFIKRITGVPYLRWLDVKTAQKVILAVRDIAVQAGYDPDGIPLKGSCCAEQ